MSRSFDFAVYEEKTVSQLCAGDVHSEIHRIDNSCVSMSHRICDLTFILRSFEIIRLANDGS